MNLEEKRALLRKLQGRADKKIKKIQQGTYGVRTVKGAERLYGKHGVDISGTRYDPRVNPENIGRLTHKQVDSAIARVSQFTHDRTLGYFAGARGEIISRKEWMKAVKATHAYNRMIRGYKESVKDLPVPWIGEGITAGDYDRDFRPKKSYLDGEAFYDLRERATPSPARFPSEKALRKYVRKTQNEITAKAQRRRMKDMRKQINQMLDRIGDDDLSKKFGNVDNETLWFMWTNDPTLANSLSLIYEQMKNLGNTDKSDNYHEVMAQVADQSEERLEGILDYAINFGKFSGSKITKKSKKGKKKARSRRRR